MNMKIDSMHAFYFHIPILSVFCVLDPDNYIRNLSVVTIYSYIVRVFLQSADTLVSVLYVDVCIIKSHTSTFLL
jgi:hypothetical protein